MACRPIALNKGTITQHIGQSGITNFLSDGNVPFIMLKAEHVISTAVWQKTSTARMITGKLPKRIIMGAIAKELDSSWVEIRKIH